MDKTKEKFVKKLLLIGCGAMGEALKKCWDNSYQVTVIDPNNPQCLNNVADLPSLYKPHILVIAIKPQILKDILPFYQNLAQNALVITIAAGVRCDFYYKNLTNLQRLVRCMPNLAVATGQGMNLLFTDSSLPLKDRQDCENLFLKTGKFLWLLNEDLFDAITTISGSGPAYVYLLSEILEKLAMQFGIDHENANLLAKQTIIGAASLLSCNEEHPANLRQKVTSSGGITEAALSVFSKEDALFSLFSYAIQAGIQRAKALQIKE